MAHLVKIPEGGSPEFALKHRIAQVNAILAKAAKMTALADDYERKGESGSARILRKRARDASKMAMKHMGILVIGHGVDMSAQASLARKIFQNYKNGNGHMSVGLM